MSLPIFDIVRNETSNLYVVIDISQFDGGIDYWKSLHHRCSDDWRLLSNEHDVQCYPGSELVLLFIEDGTATESLLLWLLSHERYPDVGIVLLMTTAGIDEVRQACMARHVCIYPDGRHVFFPFHDPTLLKTWLAMADLPTRHQFESPFLAIYVPEVVDAGYSTSQFACLGERALSTNQLSQAYENRLSAESYRVLTNQARYQYLVRFLFVRASEHYPFELSIEWLERRFISGVALARELYPAASEDERESWSAHRWIIGSDYYRHPQFIKLVSHYSLSMAIKKFKMDAALVNESWTHWHRREWMFGLADDKGV
ncbi:DUF4123 domain-containing protein [Aeromonas bivalvium]|uniref:DUF4123 domain-containing protein n=1 Tax=Aeromonas bivalvium TaxID=440079 RepID=UPI00370A6043